MENVKGQEMLVNRFIKSKLGCYMARDHVNARNGYHR